MTSRTLCALLLAGLTPTAARAVEFHHPQGPFPAHDCTCGFDGADVPPGERRCIRTAQGSRTATCVMEQNVTSWRRSGEDCPQAPRSTSRS